ncbi:MAG: hypothetical protein Q8O67_02010 [Deltaproteobacteria bacterium]|nr:hypothetical protein [Deltaproteobacteria bacterium]
MSAKLFVSLRPGSWFLRAGATLGLTLVPVAGCDCDVTDFNPVAPQIAVDVCAKPEKEANGKIIGGTEECALPFGNADLAVRVEKFFTITNPSSLELNIRNVDGDPGITFADDGDEGFVFINEPPTSIGPGLSAQIGVSIRPALESAIAREIIILSDANNVPPNDDELAEIHIPITLTGVDNGVPDIEIVPDSNCGSTDPLSVEFGRVATGGLQVCNVLVKNVGTRELFFDSVEFIPLVDGGADILEPTGSDPAPALLSGTPPNPDQSLAPTSATVPGLPLRLTFAPDVLGRYERRLRLTTSDPDEPVIEIPILGLGVDGPTCTARVKSVGGVDVTGAPTIEPLDDVVLTADAVPATPDGDIASYSWEIKERGPGSGVVLTTPTAQETSFAFANRRGVDVAGRYEACVTVVDDLGTAGVAPCCVDFEAIPSDSFLVQLTWVGDEFDDMDLHVTKKDGTGKYCVTSLGSGGGNVDAPFETCGGLDCGYYNCNPTDTGVEWDGAAGRSDGDPSLDIDDTDGFGPENINVDVAGPGSYAFGASYFSGSVPVAMFVRLFLFGRLAGEWVQTVDDDFFEVGIVHFSAEDPFRPCVEDLTDGDSDDQCPGF